MRSLVHNLHIIGSRISMLTIFYGILEAAIQDKRINETQNTKAEAEKKL